MIGSIIGDIAGSTYEFANIKTKNFELLASGQEFTDDSVLTFATADWLLHGGEPCDYYYRYAQAYPSPMGGYGTGFASWVYRHRHGDTRPYNSCGNGAAMRVGPVGWAFATEAETLAAARQSAQCTHNHPEGIKGAQATALSIFLARHGATPADIRRELTSRYGYDMRWTVDELRPRYSWQGLDGHGDGGTCQGSVPEAITCALEATSFEDAVRNAVSIGGDSDTIGCIAGAVAEALFPIPEELRKRALTFLNAPLGKLLAEFVAKHQ